MDVFNRPFRTPDGRATPSIGEPTVPQPVRRIKYLSDTVSVQMRLSDRAPASAYSAPFCLPPHNAGSKAGPGSLTP